MGRSYKEGNLVLPCFLGLCILEKHISHLKKKKKTYRVISVWIWILFDPRLCLKNSRKEEKESDGDGAHVADSGGQDGPLLTVWSFGEILSYSQQGKRSF